MREEKTQNIWARLGALLILLWLFLASVNGMGAAFKSIKPFVAESFDMFANAGPIVGLLAGIFSTCLVQSSSTTTTLIVGLVASGALSVGQAVPLIMGANVGTTITNTLVSMGSVARRDEFRRSFAAANIHDMFNLIAVVLLLPLEIMFGFIEKSATTISHYFQDVDAASKSGIIKSHFKGVIKGLKGAIDGTFESELVCNIVLLAVSIGVMILALTLIVKTMKGVVLAKAEVIFDKFIGKSAIVAMIFGFVLTVMVQSSSISTSLMVPLAGAGVVSLRTIFPITLGCNVGTTVTALIAALAITTDDPMKAEAALTIALCHLIFNLFGIVSIYCVPPIRNIVLFLSDTLAVQVSEKRWMAPAYVVIVFFVIPGVILAIQYREEIKTWF